MSKLSCGIVGLPNVGKSTLFNALVKKKTVGAANYPFCTIDPNIGIVDLPDQRLNILSKISKSHRTTPATVTFVDIAGLVQGASHGEGLGNQFLSSIRETDVILHVVRCFEDEETVHVTGKIDPIEDIEVINLELILADLQMGENSLKKLERQAKGDHKLLPSVHVLKKICTHLGKGQSIRSLPFNPEERELAHMHPFITLKKVIYVANVSEEGLSCTDHHYAREVNAFAKRENSCAITVCAKLEEELAQLCEQEMREYLRSLNIEEPGLDQLIRLSFDTLGLITFLTTGEKETRAWTIRKNTPAQEASGVIHSDIQKGFIRAQVTTFEDIVTCQGQTRAKELGKARMEGKEYEVQDGDVILFFHTPIKKDR